MPSYITKKQFEKLTEGDVKYAALIEGWVLEELRADYMKSMEGLFNAFAYGPDYLKKLIEEAGDEVGETTSDEV